MHEPGEYMGIYKEPKDKTQFHFKFCFVFSTGNSQEVCGPNQRPLIDVNLGAACTPSGYGHVFCQYLSVFEQYMHVTICVCKIDI